MRLFFIIAISSLALFSYEDLGRYGPTYDIAEQNIKKVIQRNLVEKKDEIQGMAEKAYRSGLIYNIDLSYSDKDETLQSELILNNPNKNSTQQSIAAKDIPYKINDSMCIVSFESFAILDEVIEDYGIDCRYVFLNISIDKISRMKKYSKMKKFIGNDMLFNIFDIDKTPLKITLIDKKMKFEYLDYKRITAEAKEKLLEGKK